jgi:hypothetical protein
VNIHYLVINVIVEVDIIKIRINYVKNVMEHVKVAQDLIKKIVMSYLKRSLVAVFQKVLNGDKSVMMVII